jgi:hypothetical protein
MYKSTRRFRRLTNVYFLLVVVVTLIPQVSPITCASHSSRPSPSPSFLDTFGDYRRRLSRRPYTSIVPLVFVLTVSAIREGYEDFVLPLSLSFFLSLSLIRPSAALPRG